MHARILDKSEESKWAKFIENHPFASIHQDPAWGHFQEKVPSRGKYWIAVLEKDSEIIAGTLLVRHKIQGKYCWIYAPRGPLFSEKMDIQSQLDKLFAAISEIAKKEQAIFLRIDPYDAPSQAFQNFKFTKHGFQPEHTLILDISKNEDEILAQMKPKGRYNIRLAEKKGVKIHQSSSAADIKSFYQLLSETTARDKFSGHGIDYYESMLQILEKDKKAVLYLAKYDGEVVAGLIATFFNHTATYYYGVSGNKHRNVMAPYLLHWQVIRDSKARGFKHYDFFGVAPENAQNHPWQGVTEFKTKFGGEAVAYAPAQERPFKKFLYFLYRLYKKFR